MASALALSLVPTLTGGCNRDQGLVELNWVFVDRNDASVFPDGSAAGIPQNSCAFSGRLVEGGPVVDYGLHMELRACDPDCAGGCDNPSCIVDGWPRRFSCQTPRAASIVDGLSASADTDTETTTATEPGQSFTFDVAVVAIPRTDGDEPDDLFEGCWCVLEDGCVQTPGSRERAVRPGLITDLQVYEVVLRTLDLAMREEQGDESNRISLDLEQCCEATPACS